MSTSTPRETITHRKKKQKKGGIFFPFHFLNSSCGSKPNNARPSYWIMTMCFSFHCVIISRTADQNRLLVHVRWLPTWQEYKWAVVSLGHSWLRDEICKFHPWRGKKICHNIVAPPGCELHDELWNTRRAVCQCNHGCFRTFALLNWFLTLKSHKKNFLIDSNPEPKIL